MELATNKEPPEVEGYTSDNRGNPANPSNNPSCVTLCLLAVVVVPCGMTSKLIIVPAKLSYIADNANVPACGSIVYTRNELDCAVTKLGNGCSSSSSSSSSAALVVVAAAAAAAAAMLA